MNKRSQFLSNTRSYAFLVQYLSLSCNTSDHIFKGIFFFFLGCELIFDGIGLNYTWKSHQDIFFFFIYSEMISRLFFLFYYCYISVWLSVATVSLFCIIRAVQLPKKLFVFLYMEQRNGVFVCGKLELEVTMGVQCPLLLVLSNTIRLRLTYCHE